MAPAGTGLEEADPNQTRGKKRSRLDFPVEETEPSWGVRKRRPGSLNRPADESSSHVRDRISTYDHLELGVPILLLLTTQQ